MVRSIYVLVLSCSVLVLSPVNSQNYQCSVCPVGKYKSTTENTGCTTCPANTYQDVLGAISVTQCKPCPTNSYSQPGSSSINSCSCAAGYGGDVANYSVGVFTPNLAVACTGVCETLSNKQTTASSFAVDENINTASWSGTVVVGDLQFSGMTPWWRVRFEREAVVQSVEIQNYDGQKMSNFEIRVGNDQSWTNLKSLTLCAGALTWTHATSNSYTCTSAVRGRYLYIINGANAPVLLSEVKVRGYLMPATEACVVCPAGSYKERSGPGTCTACVAGKASPVVGSTSNTCTNCGLAGTPNTYSAEGAASCTACPANTNSLVASTSIASCSCNAGYTAVPSSLTCNNFQTLYNAKKPWAHYTATKWDATTRTLLDQSGNNRNTLPNTLAITKVDPSTATDGASNPLTYIKGDITTELFFPENSIPVQFTICSVTRYSNPSTNQNRILTAAGGKDWLHGHNSQKRGVAYYGSRDIKDPQTGNVVTPKTFNTAVENVGTKTNWLVMCSKNGGVIPKNVLVDGLSSGYSTRSDADPNEWGGITPNRATQLCINCRALEKSDWELSQLMIWDTHLDDTEMNTVSQELLSYVAPNTACTATPSNACTQCVAGKYKSATGSMECTDCGPGKFQPALGADRENTCINCPDNTFAAASSMAITNCTCLAGYSALSDGNTCTACVAGSYKTTTGTGTCTQCPVNTFSTAVAQTTSTCTSCPEYASTGGLSGSDEAIDCKCNAGYTGPNGATCLSCVSGTYKTASGPQACTLCANNTYSSTVAATSASTCLACQGNSISMMGSDAHTDCHCLEGYLTNNIGQPNATCSMCSAGSYNPTLGATTCSKCEGGFSSSSPGAVSVEQCVACPVDKYSPAGAAQCESCPTNTAAPAKSDDITDCKCLSGYYSTTLGEDGRTCQACPAGTHKAQMGSAACTNCPVDKYSTATAATSSSTCLSCNMNAVSPAGSSALSMCLCDFGYKAVPITNNIPNLARSCGSGNDACAAVGDSDDGRGRPAAQVVNNDALDGSLWAWISSGSAALHWARVDFGKTAYVTGIQLAVATSWFIGGDHGYTNAGVIVGNNPNVLSPENSICTIIPAFTAGFGGGYQTFTCATPVEGQYIFISNRCNQGTVGVDRGNCNMLVIWELKVQGYTSSGISCSACTAGTFKDTLGSAACTNCPADTYSGVTAARNSSVCTQCYNNAIAPAGSDNIYDCGCSSGYEFL